MPTVWVVKHGGKTVVIGRRIEVFDDDTKAVQRAIDVASGGESR